MTSERNPQHMRLQGTNSVRHRRRRLRGCEIALMLCFVASGDGAVITLQNPTYGQCGTVAVTGVTSLPAGVPIIGRDEQATSLLPSRSKNG
jgi:hypothetical protein